jgi:hypothetical protein
MRQLSVIVIAFLASGGARADSVRVDVAPAHATNSFRPTRALGAGIDRISPQMAAAVYEPAAVKEVLSAGWGTVSYRLNTELHVEDWHWNPKGTWSEKGERGYFSADAALGEPIVASHGYQLPRRGFTRNEGTENEGFSRLTDGDLGAIWKSNPYLERAFTGEAVDPAPQWIVIELDKPDAVDAIRIAWGAPFARSYTVQYWTGADALRKPTEGQWHDFPAGVVTSGKGGTTTVVLGKEPITARFVRVLLSVSSQTCGEGGAADKRNCLGYAIKEVYLGTQGRDGKFHDLLRHSPDQQQSATACSSVDPWHSAADKTGGVQTGLDRFFSSGITRGMPAMIPVAVLYTVPESAAAEIAYLKKRGYPVSYVELGEEPDGQYMTPEHYAALYLQFAAAIHRVDPKVILGGPAFTGSAEDIPAWPDAHGNGSWLGRFLKYLEARGHLSDFGFFSFEHYPFPSCATDWESLYEEPRRIEHIMDVWRKDGLPANVPMLVTEVNVATESSQRFVEVWGGLWLADYVGAFLSHGGAGSYFFHYLPWQLSMDCRDQWGTFAMHKADEHFGKLERLSQYFASQMITQAWVAPGDEVHKVFPATSDVSDKDGHRLVTAYALNLPDGRWSLLLVNKDRQAAHAVDVLFEDTGRRSAFTGDVSITTWGAEQYVWHPDGVNGSAKPADPPRVTRQTGSRFGLPPASITVLRGRIGPQR